MKKKINIVLIAAVLGLWGVVGYRFLNNYFFAPDIAIPKAREFSAMADLVIERDTFDLKPLARDPFLSGLSPGREIEPKAKRQSANTSTLIPKSAAPKKRLIEVPWPDIEYKGYIKSGNNKELVLLRINGQLCRVHKGEAKNEIIVQAIYKDSIVVRFNKEQRSFRHTR